MEKDFPKSTYKFGNPFKERAEVKFVLDDRPEFIRGGNYFLAEFRTINSTEGWEPIDFDNGYDRIPFLSNLEEAKSIIRRMRDESDKMGLGWTYRIKEVSFVQCIYMEV